MRYGELSERDQNILKHIGRYRLSFKEVIQHLFFGAADPQKVLDRLRTEGFVEAQKGFGGNRSAYVLTGEAVTALGVKRRKGAGSQGAPQALALLSFCCLMGRSRLRMSREELAPILGCTVPGSFHCIETGEGEACVHQVYIPGPLTRPDHVADHLRDQSKKAYAEKPLHPWLDSGHYRLTVLVDTNGRKKEVEEAIERAVAADENFKWAMTSVVSVPTISNLPEALHVLLEETSTQGGHDST